MRKTDVADTEQLFRLVQSIPSKEKNFENDIEARLSASGYVAGKREEEL